ncbi:protein of unknown function [Cupriavidus taiwanensis]|uniref:Uncharacterized protein n=1 Tax=Cupriavidus taiwanensis TaxID=164546 RepID=A0A375IEP9_9BURK|nr:hypothetical protein CBM2588_A60024 [Cupriavidus taiwanensis]SOY56705.1 hypothetical protein CBM2592_A90027 [Cupriavidus taiwanensis]SOY90632.1 hypothetical protein CBM2591_A90025 [Cupriavidus taiwanensis]SOZ63217.1 hypothetical protein CBM2617_A60025 [Cupriavidus taiwanensis]SOZ82385.1 hypothetical protein CBM2618_A70024 [Cupriavidus taiwanensis]
MAGAGAGQFLPRGPRLQRQSNSPPWVAGAVLKLILGERASVLAAVVSDFPFVPGFCSRRHMCDDCARSV